MASAPDGMEHLQESLVDDNWVETINLSDAEILEYARLHRCLEEHERKASIAGGADQRVLEQATRAFFRLLTEQPSVSRPAAEVGREIFSKAVSYHSLADKRADAIATFNLLRGCTELTEKIPQYEDMIDGLVFTHAATHASRQNPVLPAYLTTASEESNDERRKALNMSPRPGKIFGG